MSYQDELFQQLAEYQKAVHEGESIILSTIDQLIDECNADDWDALHELRCIVMAAFTEAGNTLLNNAPKISNTAKVPEKESA